MGGFVYKWTNTIDGKWYIGSHEGDPDDGYVGSGLVFVKALKKYGKENFTREILYAGSDFREKEELFLKELNAATSSDSYNLKNESLGGSFPGQKNGMYGKKCSIDSNKKRSIALKENRWGSDEKKLEHASLMSGSNNPNYGKPRSEFTKEKIRQTKRMRKENWSFIGEVKTHRKCFIDIFSDLARNGELVAPRGLKVLEIENFNYVLPPYVRFVNFEARNLNVDYIKHEFLWYLNGDRFDRSIEKHARMWTGLVNEDGSINSNYGQYIFGTDNQFDDAANVLLNDKDSRRASIVILNSSHLKSETKDVPCTYSINFRIRKNRLNMSVRMRSQDAIFGMCNDAPNFSFIHEMMLHVLRVKYSDLDYGDYYHSADSFHVYERHFSMLERITGLSLEEIKTSKRSQPGTYSLVLCPQMSGIDEVNFLRRGEFSDIPEHFKFARWLNDFENPKLSNVENTTSVNVG